MDIHRLAALGQAVGANWYEASNEAITFAGGGEAILGARLIAATSPRCGIVDNLRREVRRTSPLLAHQQNIMRALNGEWPRGPKVEPFARALAGDAEAIPIDVWMARALGFSESLSLRDHQKAHARIRRAAKRTHTNPRDYAASVWCGMILSVNKRPLHYGHALRVIKAEQQVLNLEAIP